MKNHRITALQYGPKDIFLRIIPVQLTTNVVIKDSLDKKYRIFLQKGLQVLGKSDKVIPPTKQKNTLFDLTLAQNNFDFQVISDKALKYDFAFYQIQQSGKQQRKQSILFDMTDIYKKFLSQKSQQYSLNGQVKFQSFTFSYKLIISSSFQTIKNILFNILQKNAQHQKKTKKSSQMLNNLNKLNKLNRIQQVPQENLSSHVVKNSRQQNINQLPVCQIPQNQQMQELTKQQPTVNTKNSGNFENRPNRDAGKFQEQAQIITYKQKEDQKLETNKKLTKIVMGCMAKGINPLKWGKNEKKKNKKQKSKISW